MEALRDAHSVVEGQLASDGVDLHFCPAKTAAAAGLAKRRCSSCMLKRVEMGRSNE